MKNVLTNQNRGQREEIQTLCSLICIPYVISMQNENDLVICDIKKFLAYSSLGIYFLSGASVFCSTDYLTFSYATGLP